MRHYFSPLGWQKFQSLTTYSVLTRVWRNSPAHALLVRAQKGITCMPGNLVLVKKMTSINLDIDPLAYPYVYT